MIGTQIMKFGTVSALAFSAVLLAAPLSIASAADMPMKAPPAAPAPVASWAGFYIGGDLGASWGGATQSFSQNEGFPAGAAPGYDPASFGKSTSRGLSGSFHAGYNYQWSNWVAGLEGDFTLLSGSTFRQTNLTQGGVLVPGPGCPAIVGTCNTLQMRDDAQWLTDIRGRLGYAFNNTMIYATGGAAWMRQNREGYLLPSFVNTSSIATSSIAITEGWVAGGGLEYMASQHWIVRAEYLHYSFPGETLGAGCTRCVAGALSGVGVFTWSRYDLNEIRLGASYKF